MGNVLNIHKIDALDRLNKLANDLFQPNNASCDINPNMNISMGLTYCNNNGYAIKTEIGIQEIEHPKQSFRQENLNEYERQQMTHELACIDNPEYYKDNGNYSKDANEIQAEYYGVQSTYEYMCNTFSDVPPEYIESIILKIVNEKMIYSTYFLKQTEPFTSLDDVYAAFEGAYEKSFTAEQLYFVNRTPTKDRVKLYMQDHDDAKEAYLSFSDKKDKDSCIAAVNIFLHPAWQEHYPELKNMDL